MAHPRLQRVCQCLQVEDCDHSLLTSDAFIDWEQAQNHAPFHEMYRLVVRLEARKQRLQEGRKVKVGLKILHSLITALMKWLESVYMDAEACRASQKLLSCMPFAMSPSPPEGRLICQALVEDIRAYEKAW